MTLTYADGVDPEEVIGVFDMGFGAYWVLSTCHIFYGDQALASAEIKSLDSPWRPPMLPVKPQSVACSAQGGGRWSWAQRKRTNHNGPSCRDVLSCP